MADPPKNEQGDLVAATFDNLSWGDDAQAAASLDAIYDAMMAKAVKAQDWYLGRRKWWKRYAQLCRWAAVALFAIGAVVPVLAAANGAVNATFGYVFIAFAAALLTLNRYLGFTTTWIRCVMTGQRIEREVEALQFAWADAGLRAVGAPADDVPARLELLREFSVKLGQIVDDETATWAAQTEESLGQIEHSVLERARAHGKDQGKDAGGKGG